MVEVESETERYEKSWFSGTKAQSRHREQVHSIEIITSSAHVSCSFFTMSPYTMNAGLLGQAEGLSACILRFFVYSMHGDLHNPGREISFPPVAGANCLRGMSGCLTPTLQLAGPQYFSTSAAT
jgi:hypothetical protein